MKVGDKVELSIYDCTVDAMDDDEQVNVRILTPDGRAYWVASHDLKAYVAPQPTEDLPEPSPIAGRAVRSDGSLSADEQELRDAIMAAGASMCYGECCWRFENGVGAAIKAVVAEAFDAGYALGAGYGMATSENPWRADGDHL